MTALGLKLLASVFMLIDHIGYCFYGPMILRIIGRLAFPIYVFQMTEGYRRTSNRLRYAVRLAIFGLISQVPFSLMIEGVPMQRDLNVMFTLLIGYLAIWLLETLKHKAGLLALGIGIVLGVQMLYFRDILQSDYGKTGILLALAFYYLYPSRRQPEPQGLLRSHRNQSTILLIACFLAVFFSHPDSYGRAVRPRPDWPSLVRCCSEFLVACSACVPACIAFVPCLSRQPRLDAPNEGRAKSPAVRLLRLLSRAYADPGMAEGHSLKITNRLAQLV